MTTRETVKDLIEALSNPLLVTDERFDLARKAADELARLWAELEQVRERGRLSDVL